MVTEKQWSEMTPEEKREERFRKWLEAPDVEFNSPEAKKAYQERVTRLIKVIKLQEPDRVPVMLPAGNFPAYYAGVTLQTVMYDYDELLRAGGCSFVTLIRIHPWDPVLSGRGECSIELTTN